METKQVIVLRKDLNMRKGKMVAQGAHASLKVFLDRLHSNTRIYAPPYAVNAGQLLSADSCIDFTPEMATWLDGNQAKICVSVNSELELLGVYQKAKDAGLPCSLIKDAGLTEFGGVPTYTAVAIGPDKVEEIDKITSDLPLL